MWLTSLFQSGVLDNHSIRYSIVNENGASIYSCSDVATKEFPKMDMNEISAGLSKFVQNMYLSFDEIFLIKYSIHRTSP